MAARYINKDSPKQPNAATNSSITGTHAKPSRFVVKRVLERPFYDVLAKIEKGEMDIACSLIAHRRFDLNETDENGQTLLMAACSAGARPVVQSLLKEGAFVNTVDVDHWSALMVASKQGFTEIVTDLLSADAEMELRDAGGWTALMWACYKGRVGAVQELLKRGSNCNVKAQHNMTCLIWASGRGHKDIVDDLLQHGARADVSDKHGTSPLIWAARKGHLAVVLSLLNHGANVDIVGMHSLTALLVALKGAYREVARAILSAKPNPNVTDKDGMSPLSIAAREGYEELVGDLLELGAYVNVVDKSGDSVLIQAVKGGHLNIVKTILRRNADLDIAGSDERTALYCAVDKEHVEILKLLLSQNPNKEIPDKDGNSPLLRAVRNRNVEITDLLLDRGAKVSACDKKGDTALHVAMRARARRLVEMLLKNPRNSRLLYVRNKVGETPYSIDAGQQRSILTQIFGARSLNDAETIESQLGYELYSGTLADVLSSPTLATPMTVGLYAKWGSGKSFMLSKLREDMMAFTRNATVDYFHFSWLSFAVSFTISVTFGLIVSLGYRWEAGVPVGCTVLALLYILQGLLWYGDYRRGWQWASKMSSVVAARLRRLCLLLKLLFCNRPPPVDNSALTGISFLFADSTKLTSLGGEMSLATMVGSLFESVEKRYGALITRLFRVFGTHSEARSKYKGICCVPYFVIVSFVVICLIVGLVLVMHYSVPADTLAPNVIMSVLCAIVAMALLVSAHNLARAIYTLACSSRRRVIKACRDADGDGGRHHDELVQRLKSEIQMLSSTVATMDRFTGWQTRLVLVIDGLDSCEQDKVLQVLDTMSLIISDESLPFIVLLAVDPHVIIKGIEANLNKAFHDSSLNGHAYLRNLVHLPFYLQNHGLPLMVTGGGGSAATAPDTPRQVAKDGLVPETKSSKKQASLWSSQTSVAGGERGAGARSFYSGVLGLHASHAGISDEAEQMHRSIAKSDYFVDISPRSIRRLMNIISVAGRLLRANEIEFNWYRLSAWINITEQWPYRTSWLLLHYEECDGKLDDTLSLKVIYDKISTRIPTSREVEPLLDVDKNEKKFVAFLSSHTPKLNVSDIRKFMPATINLDPYLRKLIKEKIKDGDMYDGHNGSFSTTPLFPSDAAQLRVPATTVASPFGRLPSPAHAMSGPGIPCYYPWFYSPPQQPAASDAAGRMDLRQLAPDKPPSTQPPLSSQARALVPKGFRSLSSLSVDDVCRLLAETRGLSEQRITRYQQTIQENNVCGLVLAQCDLDELKPVLQMAFGDWQLFKTVLLAMRQSCDFFGDSSQPCDAVPYLDISAAGSKPSSLLHSPTGRVVDLVTASKSVGSALPAVALRKPKDSPVMLEIPSPSALSPRNAGGTYPAATKMSAMSQASAVTTTSRDTHASVLSRKDSSLDCVMIENHMIRKAMLSFAANDLSEESDNDIASYSPEFGSSGAQEEDGAAIYEDAKSAVDLGGSGGIQVRFSVLDETLDTEPLVPSKDAKQLRPSSTVSTAEVRAFSSSTRQKL